MFIYRYFRTFLKNATNGVIDIEELSTFTKSAVSFNHVRLPRELKKWSHMVIGDVYAGERGIGQHGAIRNHG